MNCCPQTSRTKSARPINLSGLDASLSAAAKWFLTSDTMAGMKARRLIAMALLTLLGGTGGAYVGNLAANVLFPTRHHKLDDGQRERGTAVEIAGMLIGALSLPLAIWSVTRQRGT